MDCMIGDLLAEIKRAEDEAGKIVGLANVKATRIAVDAENEIAKINSQTADTIAKIAVAEFVPTTTTKANEMTLMNTPDAKRIATAKKLVIDEFHKRYAK